jgi:nucleoside-diphosphate-sugar epimerase
MNQTKPDDFIVGRDDLILITGATGFIGSKVVESLRDRGFRNLRCFARTARGAEKLEALYSGRRDGFRLEVIRGNLLSRENCVAGAKDAAVIFHLAAGRGEKSFPDAFLNSVVTTRNLLDACADSKSLKRFVNVSSFAVYDNTRQGRGRLLDETCLVEARPEARGDAYCFAKANQDRVVAECGEKFNIPYVIVRPGAVYGPGNLAITGRVGTGSFGLFLHLGGSNTLPLTYVDNCVEAIVLAGLKSCGSGEIFNVVDDDLPSSRQFLRLYKRNVRDFRSIYLPHGLSYLLCYLWERYSVWSEGQLAPVYNRNKWRSLWKKTRYSNEKLKTQMGWTPKVTTAEGLNRYFEACRLGDHGA